MADPVFITDLDEISSFNDADLGVNETNPGGTPETNKITRANILAQYLKRTNYQITRTVSSNNLVLSILDPDGNAATSSKPINFLINGAIRKLTGSLSLQINAGVNTFNLGASEFANLVQELFVYVGWRASTSSIFLLVSRLPYLREYADVSTTATNERYGAASGAAPAASDQLALIGRVNVMNSGSALYHWSIPAANQIINRPIFETNWMDWLPTPTGFSVNPSGVNRYRVEYSSVSLFVRQNNNGTSNSTGFTLSLPFTAKTITNMNWGSSGVVVDNGTILSTPGLTRVLSGATVMDVFKDMATGAFTASGSKRLANMNIMTYEIGV